MASNTAEFTVNIPTENPDEPLRGKFKVKIRLSYREILAMDSIRRQLVGPQGGEIDGLAQLLASNLAKIQVHTLESPKWFKDAGNGLDFDDINVILTIAGELNKVEKDYQEELSKLADAAAEKLKAEVK